MRVQIAGQIKATLDWRLNECLDPNDRHRRAQIGAIEQDVGEAQSGETQRETARDGLDFREFRHRSRCCYPIRPDKP